MDFSSSSNSTSRASWSILLIKATKPSSREHLSTNNTNTNNISLNRTILSHTSKS